jgi:hypothetical protein
MKIQVFCKGLMAVLLLVLISGVVHAGNIDPDGDGHKYAWGENVGWLNFDPSQGPGVTVYADHLTGYVWAENIGWIKLGVDAGGPYDNTTVDNWGVNKDSLGNLSGWAWVENAGWICFSCDTTGTCATVSYGVAIDPESGDFSGYAWGENIGWIKFDHSQANLYGVKTAWNDADADDIHGDLDNCPFNYNPGQADGDSDGLGDVCDTCPNDPNNDSDNDSLCGDADNCPGVSNSDQLDADLDLIGDECDTCPDDPDNDADNDSVCGDVDNCPINTNPNQSDADGDGIGDACDTCTDTDNDRFGNPGFTSNTCDEDNCPNATNPDQADTDTDGTGDICDACPNDAQNDTDGDGICGDVDNCPLHHNPNQVDADNDGIGDECEGELSGDGVIDSDDLDILLSELDSPGENCPACDLNNDGVITTLDILDLVKLNPLLARDRRLRTLLRSFRARPRR